MSMVKFVVDDGFRIRDLFSFVEYLHKTPTKRRRFFRGLHRSDFKLVPSIAYDWEYGGKVLKDIQLRTERELLHRFTRRALPHVGHLMNEWEALFLARHHGLPTRIMDWTINPLAALYFACSQSPDKSGVVWMMNVRHDLTLDNPDTMDVMTAVAKGSDGPFDPPLCGVDCVKAIYPFLNSPRIAAQQGHFTYHGNPLIPLDVYGGSEFDSKHMDVERLVRFTVVQEFKQDLLLALDKLGVNQYTVFPDLDGLARGVVNAEVLYNGN